MNIEIFGKDERVASAAEYLSGELASAAGNLKLLPIPSSKDGEHVTGTELSFNELFSSLNSESLVVGYGLPDGFCRSLDACGVRYYDAAEDEEFLMKNAAITAVAALGYVLNSSKKAPSDMSFGIIGYGRIGKELLRLLLFLGAEVKVFTGKAEKKAELGRLGIKTGTLDAANFAAEAEEGMDVIFNTAPTNLSAFFENKRIPEGVRVLELASGDSFPGVFGVEYLPTLPARVFPKSAGLVYAALALRFFKRNAV